VVIIGRQAQAKEAGMKYVCKVCGYIYDPEIGDLDNDYPAGTLFEELPDDWTCPACGAAKDMFEPMKAS
jgi:rubredoxin